MFAYCCVQKYDFFVFLFCWKAFPLLIIGINGRNYTSDALVVLRENAVAYCYAVGARPPANLTWVIDNEVAHPSKVSYSTSGSKKQHTYDPIAVLDLPNNKPRINISCQTSIGEIHGNHNKTMITIMIDIEGKQIRMIFC